MVKRFSLMLVLITAFIIINGNNPVEAREVYVGSYSDGTAVYLLDETIKERNYSNSVRYWCTVRAAQDYIDYEFWAGSNSSSTWYYKNSEGYSGAVYDGSSPVATAILNHILR